MAPGVYTSCPLGSEARRSVIDLTLASPPLAPFFISWDTPLPSTGSDHIPISLTFAHPVQAPPALELDWTRSDCVTGAPCRKMDPKSATAPKIPFVESATQHNKV